ncbi:chorion protein 18 [Musca autumnalis]|uniref:chorion protein 18 n=1 Tax=Musca autumnalis TaxID=221902 RepID=UPI003CECABE7
MFKILCISALFVAAQAGYAPAARKAYETGGYAAQVQPRVTNTVYPQKAAYGGYGYGHGSASSASSVAGLVHTPTSALDAEVLRLAAKALALPSPGAPLSTQVRVPVFHNTAYSFPAVAAVPAVPQGAHDSSAAAAASNVNRNHAKTYGHLAGQHNSGYGASHGSNAYGPSY